MNWKKNPLITKFQKLTPEMIEAIEENIVHFSLPYDPKGFISWEKNTHQINLYRTSEEREQAIRARESFMWMPRNMFKGRFLPQGMSPINQLDRDKYHIAVIGAVQFITYPDHTEILMMATRKGWKRQGIMNVLMAAIKEATGDKRIEFWSPTKAGAKFEKAFRKKEK